MLLLEAMGTMAGDSHENSYEQLKAFLWASHKNVDWTFLGGKKFQSDVLIGTFFDDSFNQNEMRSQLGNDFILLH